MRHYELTYLISPELSEEEIRGFQEKIISLIQGLGSELLGETKTPIRKKMAYLATLNFNLDPEKLGSLEKGLKSENQVLRYIILAKPRTKEVLVRGEKVPSSKLPKKIVKPEAKVELKEIEKKLDEMLGES